MASKDSAGNGWDEEVAEVVVDPPGQVLSAGQGDAVRVGIDARHVGDEPA